MDRTRDVSIALLEKIDCISEHSPHEGGSHERRRTYRLGLVSESSVMILSSLL